MALRRSTLGAVRQRLVDSPQSLGARQRLQRWHLLSEIFPTLPTMRVLDLGGTSQSWLRAPVRPHHVTVLNLFEPGDASADWITPVTGDACAAREVLAARGLSTGYDLVFSNSLLEHVGGHANRQRLCDEMSALAPNSWLQTPYRYFPLEPHWLCPGMQFLPLATRARVARHWPLAHTPAPDMATAMSEVQWTELVGIAEMRAYLPDARIHHERVLGLTKSLIAVRLAGELSPSPG